MTIYSVVMLGLIIVVSIAAVALLYSGDRVNRGEHNELKEDLDETKADLRSAHVTLAAHTDRLGQIEGKLAGDAFERKHQAGGTEHQ